MLRACYLVDVVEESAWQRNHNLVTFLEKKKEKASVRRLQRRTRWGLLRALLAMGEPPSG